jgi:hypothetical protein
MEEGLSSKKYRTVCSLWFFPGGRFFNQPVGESIFEFLDRSRDELQHKSLI